jgi:hypothetical protein
VPFKALLGKTPVSNGQQFAKVSMRHKRRFGVGPIVQTELPFRLVAEQQHCSSTLGSGSLPDGIDEAKQRRMFLGEWNGQGRRGLSAIVRFISCQGLASEINHGHALLGVVIACDESARRCNRYNRFT